MRAITLASVLFLLGCESREDKVARLKQEWTTACITAENDRFLKQPDIEADLRCQNAREALREALK